MKKKSLLVFGIIVTVISIGICLSTIDNQNSLESLKKQGNQIAVYIQDDAGEYQTNNIDKFPTHGYVLNTKKSSCKNGSIISQNESTKKIKIRVLNNDECSLYFDTEVTALALNKLGITVKDGTPDFSKIAPEIGSYIDDQFNGNELSRSQSASYQERYYTYADSYTFDEIAGTYTLVNPQICKYSECYDNLVNKYIVSSSGSTKNSGESSSDKKNIYKVTNNTTLDTLYYILSTKTNIYNLEKDGVYAMEDDYGISYYYRGAVTNNYVKFGKWNKDVYYGYYDATSLTSYSTYNSLEECQASSQFNVNCKMGIAKGADMWWRIIRINGNGTLRVIYDGTSAHDNGEISIDRTLARSNWNENYSNDAKYVGYMYGGANGEISTSKIQAQTNQTDSTIKTYLDTWYQENILATGNAKYVSDTLFCNDRTTDGIGFGGANNDFDYGSYIRAKNSKPQFKCPEKNDAFTVSDTTKGNGALTYPVGLVTVDELVVAGTQWLKSSKGFYLNKGVTYWSLSPREFSNKASYNFWSSGDLNSSQVTANMHVVPVINLSSEFIENIVGDGTATNPYTIE